jgi:hypothetical protein
VVSLTERFGPEQATADAASCVEAVVGEFLAG